MIKISKLLEEHGYIVLEPADDTGGTAATLGRAGPPVILRARPRDAADPWSLSGVYGVGAFPWHTDGAIDPNPPRWLMLTAVEVTEPTYTELLAPAPQVWAALRRTVLRAVDRRGRARHLPAALPAAPGRWRLRWDPRTCEPTGDMTIEDMARQEATADVAWRPGRTVILDNSRLLHRHPL